MKYDIDYFIKFYEDTKEEEWCCGKYWNAEDKTRCAFGMIKYDKHGGLFNLMPGTQGDMYIAIGRIFAKGGYYLPDVNDGVNYTEFNQPTPRQRVLTALRKLKENE